MLRDARPERRKRIEEVRDLAFRPKNADGTNVVFCREPRRSQYLPDGDVEAAHGAEWVSSEEEARFPTAGEVFGFTVVEDKQDNTGRWYQRRRFIGWPRAHNDWLKRRGYKADVPLEHVSAYLHAARERFATTGDCKVGFWQIEIPRDCRARFRGRTASGRLFQLKLLCMGESPSVELMQFVAEMLVGHPNSAQPQRVIADARHSDVWVDGFRITASTEDATNRIIERVNDNARKYRVTLKDPLRVEKRYEFVGVEFDHDKQRVRVAAKTRRKLEQQLPMQTTYGDLEQFIGRIIFAAAVNQSPLVRMWFALKWVRRRLNWLNKGRDDQGNLISEATVCSFQQQRSVWAQLEQHRRNLVQWHDIATIDGTGSANLFVDASKFGAGGVLLRPDGSIAVVGRAWTEREASTIVDGEQRFNISQLEAKAAGWAVGVLQQQLRQYRSVTLHVDNTSVQAAIRKGNARSDAVAQEVAQLVRHLIPTVGWKVTRVASADNPADGPSRGIYAEHDMLQKKARKEKEENERSGGGERVAFATK